MTTWLLENFEDIETREEAEDLGNALMVQDEGKGKDKDSEKSDKKKGLFVHVERRTSSVMVTTTTNFRAISLPNPAGSTK